MFSVLMPVILSCDNFLLLLDPYHILWIINSFFRKFMEDLDKCFKKLIILQYFSWNINIPITSWKGTVVLTQTTKFEILLLLYLRLKLCVFITNNYTFSESYLLPNLCFLEDLNICSFLVLWHQFHFSSLSMINCCGCEIICNFQA